MTTMKSNTMFFNNWDVPEEFQKDNNYIDHVWNHLALSLLTVVDCHKGYIVLVHARDEELYTQIPMVIV